MNHKIFLITALFLTLFFSCKKNSSITDDGIQKQNSLKELTEIKDFSVKNHSKALDSAQRAGELIWNKKILGITPTVELNLIIPVKGTEDSIYSSILEISYNKEKKISSAHYIKYNDLLTNVSNLTDQGFAYLRLFKRFNNVTKPLTYDEVKSNKLVSNPLLVSKFLISQNGLDKSSTKKIQAQGTNCIIGVSWSWYFWYEDDYKTYDKFELAQSIKGYIGQYFDQYRQGNEYSYDGWYWGSGSNSLVFSNTQLQKQIIEQICYQSLQYAADRAGYQYRKTFTLNDFSISSTNSCESTGGGSGGSGSGTGQGDGEEIKKELSSVYAFGGSLGASDDGRLSCQSFSFIPTGDNSNAQEAGVRGLGFAVDWVTGVPARYYKFRPIYVYMGIMQQNGNIITPGKAAELAASAANRAGASLTAKYYGQQNAATLMEVTVEKEFVQLMNITLQQDVNGNASVSFTQKAPNTYTKEAVWNGPITQIFNALSGKGCAEN